MQTTLLTASTYFNSMATRVQTVDNTESYRDTRQDWSVLDAADSSTDNRSETTRKMPTESDDRDEYSSDSERAEDDVDGAGGWNTVGSARRLSEEDGGGFEIATVCTARPLLTATLSLGESVVFIATEPASADTAAAQFSFPSDVDENGKAAAEEEEDGGLKEIADGVRGLNLKREDSAPASRGPNGGKATKPAPGTDNRSPGSDGRGQEPNESFDGGYFDGQPSKFYRPNSVDPTSVRSPNDGYDFHAGHPTQYNPTLRIHDQAQRPWYDSPTGQCFPTKSLQAPVHYFETPPRQVIGQPTHLPQAPSTMYGLGFPNAGNNHFQPSPLSPSRYEFGPETFYQGPDFGRGFHRDTFPGRLSTNVQSRVVAPCSIYQQRPVHDREIISNVRTMPHVSVHDGSILMHDPYRVVPGNSGALSTEPVIVHTTSQPSELDDILCWLHEQPETHSLETNRRPMPGHHPEFVELNVSAPYSDGLPLSSPGYCLPQHHEVTPTATTTLMAVSPYPNAYTHSSTQISSSSVHVGAYNATSVNPGLSPPRCFLPNVSTSQTFPLPGTASPPSGTFPYSNPASVTAVSMSPSTTSGCDPGDDTGSHSYSPRSDTTQVVTMTSDQGSVASSPSSVSEDGVTILIGDEAQVAEAESIVDSIPELDLINQDSQGDTPLHVAILDDQLYLAEALLRRLIRRDLLRQIINVRNKLQQTPLCLAVICNKPQIVETLVENGADVNVHLKASDDYLGTKFSQPLHLASSRGHLWKQTLKKLLRSTNIDLDAFNSDGKSALHCAIEGHGKPFKDATIDCKDTLRMLAERGANLNQPDCGHEKTPLHYAIERRDVELVSRLLVLARQYTPDHDLCSVAKMLEARTGNGNTALHLAASVDMETAEHKKLIQQLMSKGADPSSKNSDGSLPRELTKNRAIVELLKGRTASGR